MRTLKWVLVMLLMINYLHKFGYALTVDNELVSARNDCFERIALEAMMPFEKAFRTEDTNSLKMCKDKCLQTGDKCQTIAFGVHRRGNGTCQLSSEKFDSAGSRPVGTIFDPDFDMYARKTNCFDLEENSIPSSETLPVAPLDVHSLPTSFSTIGTTILNDPPNRFSPQPTDTTMPYPSTEYSDNGHKTDIPFSSSRPTSAYPNDFQTTSFDGIRGQGNGWSNANSNANGDKIFFSHDSYPLYQYPMLYENNYPAPNVGMYLPGGYAQNAQPVGDRYKPGNSGSAYGSQQSHKPVFGLGYGNGYSYGTPVSYKTTVRPQSERPSADQSFNRPEYGTRPASDRPDYGSRPASDQLRPEYGSRPGDIRPNDRPDYVPPSRPGYDQKIDPNLRPDASDRPDYGLRPASDRPRPEYGSRPGDIRPNDRPDYVPPSRPGYDQKIDHNIRPDYNRPTTNTPHDDPTRPYNIDYNNRPDPVYEDQRPPVRDGNVPRPIGSGDGPSLRPLYSQNGQADYDYQANSGYNNRRMGNKTNAFEDDRKILTFFNPDYYNTQANWSGGQRGDRYPNDDGQMNACFRRVLAGKRIAPHWVRRTLACERVEDCMRECGHEKRFMCEGFNYRLDPSGHGQGDCELIEMPLAQMDLYSSPHNRDSNLLRHPDYDYYERDRNAPSSCRKSSCKDCSLKPLSSSPVYFKPSGYDKPYQDEHYSAPSGGSGFGTGPDRYPSSVDRYRPSPPIYDSRPDFHQFDFSSSSHDSHSSSHAYFEHHRPPPSSYGSDIIDRYDVIRPDDHYRPSKPDRWEPIPSSHGSTGYSDFHVRPEPDRADHFRPPYRPGPDYSPYRPHHDAPYHSSPSHDAPPPPFPPSHSDSPYSTSGHGGYLDRDRPSYSKPQKFVPYIIGAEKDWGSYGGSYGGVSYSKDSDYWGIRNSNRRKDSASFNYWKLGGPKDLPYGPNAISDNSGSRYGADDRYDSMRDRHDYRQQWTRRPGQDECSVKTSEGFRLHKTAIKHSHTAPTITECERLCSSENSFICHTYSYRYTTVSRENCMLCDRAINNLDYYVDIEPDRDFDIYSMSDDLSTCRQTPGGASTALSDPRTNAQCFFRAIDATRFFKSIVRDSLNVRSIGECELECIKSSKFTCRAFAYRYGQRSSGGIIDNCQLSDWPVRDMDKERHLILDPVFDVFERASYGHGCEIQPIVDDKHKKLCYLGYGSSAKLLSNAIKKVISVPTEAECRKECARFRETTPFKCYSFSFGSQASTFNCEMSDLDQTELKLNVHYAQTRDRDYWLFAWNPFDWTCRDKVNTIGGTRVNNDRRMDIFREPGEVTWRHFTVSGKACRVGSPCAKNLVTGFYSCEIDGGEIGSWDYCCKEDHPCGYSRGFEYAWCFVGDEHDQWRKCSDRYYPGNHTHAGITLPPKDNNKKKHDHYQRPPRPGGLHSLNDFTAARLWPVTYLYSEGPPNSTEFSNFVDCNKETC